MSTHHSIVVARSTTPLPLLPKPSPRSTALVAFLELHDAAKFDPAITEADLITHAEKALASG
ncbi:hypothetical protein [Dactylosporangium sp. NPDC050588]|uniref:hypothetical protein n=1 Tax=Dactylosporangium sp. NPDC050588 TaxID=3157211 RepID=UPI0033CB9E15